MLRSLRSRAASLVAIALVSTALPGAAASASASAPAAPAPVAALGERTRAWVSTAVDPAGVTGAISFYSSKLSSELDDRIRYVRQGLLRVMVSVSDRDASLESFVDRSTTWARWYFDNPRFYAAVTPDQFATLLRSPAVMFVEPDVKLTYFTSASTVDIHARSLTGDGTGVWSYDATAGAHGALRSEIPGLSIDQATGAGVTVAITDSGVDRTHRDFGGWDCTPGPYAPCESRILRAVTTEHLIGGADIGDSLPTTEAASGHGTHVSGIVAGNGYAARDGADDAVTYGGDGVPFGVAPQANLVMTKNGDTLWAGLSSFGLEWQLENAEVYGIRVSSNSWGCVGGCAFSGASATGQLFKDMYNAGIVTVFAAGNDAGTQAGTTFSGNAQSPYVLGVAAYEDADHRLASFSSRGSDNTLPDPATWTPASEPVNGERRPDVGAPGVAIWSARTLTGGAASLVPRVTTSDVVGGGDNGIRQYASMGGTSMATPHVAGAAALAFSACPTATPLDFMRAVMATAGKDVLKTTGTQLAEPFEVGYGGLEMRATVDWLLARNCGSTGGGGPTPTPTPTPTGTPTATPTAAPELVSHTLYMDGVDQFGEVDQGANGTYLKLLPAAGSSEKSIGFFSLVASPNTNCGGNNLMPVFLGSLSGHVVGDMKISFSVDSTPANQAEIRVWPDLSAQACNDAYVEPAGSVIVDLPTGQGVVEATIPGLDFTAQNVMMVQITPVLAVPSYARVFYGTSASKVTFDTINAGTPDPDPTSTPTASPSSSPTTQPPTGSFAYANYQPTNGLGAGAAEPTIGVNPATGAAFFQAGTETLKVDFNGGGTPTWSDTGAPLTSITTLDPILWTDPETGRTFVSQLAAGCSLMAYTDDDGATWTENPIGCGIASGIDHQTVSGGNFAVADPQLQSIDSEYPNAVYYCSHASVDATCEISLDGGDTFTPANPIYTALDCFGLHGHLSVALDGTLYVPNFDCGGKVATVVSEDNGLTWDIRKVAASTTQDESDPSAAVNPDGTVYLGWEEGANNANGSKAFVGVSDDKGLSWQHVQNVAPQINNVQFPAMVAGSDGRAALTFLGTTTPGDDQAAGFQGVWHLYISTTLDGGKTWTTVNATPNDPVQRGCIWLAGGDNACRNLLDFIDITIDEDGRVLAAYADGCVSAACIGSGGTPAMSRAELASIARQVGGPRLLASATDPDPTESPSASASPSTSPTTQPPQGVIFEDEGRIEIANPVSDSAAGGITQNEYLFWCDGLAPFSQGLDGYVFMLPEAISGAATATLVGSESPIGHDLDMYFYDEECAPLGEKATIDADETSAVPVGTKYIIANAWLGLETLATLTVTGGGVDPTTSPTASPTVSASPSASPSDPGPGGVRGTYPATPNDPYFGVDPTGPTDFRPTQWGLRKVLAPQAWQLATGFGIRVGVIDSGVDLEHEDLQCPGKLEVNAGSDVVSNDSNPDDEFGHGTHVAGIIAACTNNGTGVAGIAPDATIVPIRVLDAAGSGNDAQLIAGLDKARQLGVHVINMSLGYQPGKQVINDVGAIDQAIERAREAGIVIVAAAGNDSSPLCDYPALAADIICVGATDIRDLKAAYSTFPNKVNGTAIGNGMVAPGGSSEPFCDSYGENILSTVPVEKDTDGCADVQGYQTKSGTSMASPHVAGVAALLYDRLGGTLSTANAQTVINTLLSTTEDLGTPGYDPVFGYGRLDAQAAVAAITPPIEMVVTEIEFGPDSAQSTQYSDDATFSAVLTDETGAAMADAELEFELTGADESRTWTATTDASGLASKTQTITDEPGAYSLSVRFAGDSTYEASAGQMGFVVEKETTATSVALARDGRQRTLTATVADAGEPSGLAEVDVTFFAGDVNVGSAVTDVNGRAVFEVPAEYSRSNYVYTARFGGSPRYASSDSAPTNPVAEVSTLEFTPASDSTGRFTDSARFEARLVDQGGDPIAGGRIVLALTGEGYSKEWEIFTDANGVATRQVNLDGTPGTYGVGASYEGRFDTYDPSSDSTGFEIMKEITESSLAVTGKGSKTTLEATLQEDDGPGVAGQQLVFFSDGTEIGRVTTNANGQASLTNIPGKYRSGHPTFEARYAGSSSYQGSSATQAT